MLASRWIGVAVVLAGIAVPQEPHAPKSSPPLSNGIAPAKTAADDAHYLDMPTARILAVLDDPQNRVPTAFRVPRESKAVVGFWLKVYAKYSLYQTIIYDRDQPDVIYDVIDSRELFQKGLSPVALEITAKNRIKSSVGALRAAMASLVKNPRAKFPTGSAGGRLLRLWGRPSSREWRRIAEALRTQAGQRDRIMDGLTSAERFFPAMEAIFRKFKIPPEITRLPLVESSFNLRAESKAAAVGVWQFLEKSAAEYLVVDVDNRIDERLSPIKSTYAAAKMFKRNYKLLDDWGLAIIAYNHGAKNLLPIRRKFQGKNIAQLLRATRDSPLGYASRSFYAEFLAMLHAERYKDLLYNMAERQHSDAISIVRMKRPASVFEIASLYNISIHELRLFNPDIFDLKRRLPAGTRVVLPRKHGESLVLAPRLNTGAPAPDQAGSPARGIASEVEYIEYVK